MASSFRVVDSSFRPSRIPSRRLPLPVLLLVLQAIGLLALPRFAIAQAELVLKPDDSIVMQVFGESDLTTRTRILKSGEATFPLVGSVKLAGLTLSKATDHLRDLYNKDYLVEPKITLTIENYARETVTVSGAVVSPGSLAIPSGEGLDLSTALISSGGLSGRADVNRITLMRANGKIETYTDEILRKPGTVPLRPGDRVLVADSQFLKKKVTMLGKFNRPGEIPFPPDGKLDLLSAINAAGGFNELANQKKVEINRGGKVTRKNVREMIETGEKYFLLPDDIINVPERLF